MISRIALVYFSGTGNTAYLAKQMQQDFAVKDVTCDLIPMEDIALGKMQLDWKAFDLIGFAYPVHAFDAPRNVMEFLAALPVGRYRYFLFKTAGNKVFNGGSSRRPRFILAQKGWQIVHEAIYEMPANMGKNRNTEFIKAIVAKACSQVQISVQQILEERKVILKDYALARFVGNLNKLETKGLKKMSGMWAVNSACTQCGLCAQNCPTANISILDGKISFGESCVMCLRCWWNCPVRALSHKMANPFLLKETYKLD
jgi:ferredoxin